MEFFLQILSVERDIVNGKWIFQRNTELGDDLITGMEIPKEFSHLTIGNPSAQIIKINKKQYP